MRITLTGGTGFIGTSVARALLRRDDRVTVLTRSRDRASELSRAGAVIVEGSITDAQACQRAVAHADAVIHSAGVPKPARRSVFEQVHVQGTQNMIAAASAADVSKFVNISSQAAVFDGRSMQGDETLPYPQHFVDPYSETKARGEQVAMAADDPHAMRVTSVRPGQVWGRGDTTVLPAFEKMMRYLRFIPVPGDHVEPTSHIANLTDGILLALDGDASAGRVYFILDDFEVTWKTLMRRQLEAVGRTARFVNVPRHLATGGARVIDRTADALGLINPLVSFGAYSAVSDRRFSIARAKAELGYQPRINLQQGVDDLRAWRASQSQ